VNGFLPALSLAIVLTVVTTIVNVGLAVDEDESFYEELARAELAGRGRRRPCESRWSSSRASLSLRLRWRVGS
jgi:hypothetical protein